MPHTSCKAKPIPHQHLPHHPLVRAAQVVAVRQGEQQGRAGARVVQKPGGRQTRAAAAQAARRAGYTQPGMLARSAKATVCSRKPTTRTHAAALPCCRPTSCVQTFSDTSDMAAIARWVHILCDELVQRLADDEALYRRRPRTLGEGWGCVVGETEGFRGAATANTTYCACINCPVC